MKEHAAREQMSHVPFAFGWYSWDLAEYRPFPVEYAMYWLFPYETLPPVPAPDPAFTFLVPDDNFTFPNPALDTIRLELRNKSDVLTRAVARAGLMLPETFVRFMSWPELHARFRSGTGYWFTLSDRLVPCPGFDDGYLIGFLRDQQDCIVWCLCLTQDGKHCVVALPDDAVQTLPASDMYALYGDLDLYRDLATDDVWGLDSSRDTEAGSDAQETSSDEASAINDICICARSFDEFVYRFWLEDEIIWKLAGLDKTALTDAERCYLDHYERQRQSGV